MPAKTIKQRLDEYERLASVSAYVGTGVAALAIIGTADLSSRLLHEAPDWIAAAFLTTALVAAGCLARGYSGFRWAHRELTKYVEDTPDVAITGPPPQSPAPPKSAEAFYKLGLLLVIGAACWLIAGIWWGVA